LPLQATGNAAGLIDEIRRILLQLGVAEVAEPEPQKTAIRRP